MAETVEIAARLLWFASPYSAFREHNTLVLAGLLSALLHLALLKQIIDNRPALPEPPLPETEIALVFPSPVQDAKTPAAPSGDAPSTAESAPQIEARLPPADAPSPDERREAADHGWVQSRAILSSQALADPRNRKTAETLKHVEPQTRLQQLCNLEAILQINRQSDRFAVDFVIAHATEAVVRKGDAVIAHGAAFHSNGRWYNLAFECQLSTSQRDVAHLKFKVGDAIPGEQWAELNLPKAPANPLGGD